MLYFIISAVCGIGGGIVSSHTFKEYTLGMLGNAITGFLGGVAIYTVIVLVTGGIGWFLAIIGGFLGGFLVRIAFSIIRQRMSPDS